MSDLSPTKSEEGKQCCGKEEGPGTYLNTRPPSHVSIQIRERSKPSRWQPLVENQEPFPSPPHNAADRPR